MRAPCQAVVKHLSIYKQQLSLPGGLGSGLLSLPWAAAGSSLLVAAGVPSTEKGDLSLGSLLRTSSAEQYTLLQDVHCQNVDGTLLSLSVTQQVSLCLFWS